jgi:hypothetical protein
MLGHINVSQVDPTTVDQMESGGRQFPAAQKLSDWISRLGGYVGELTDPTGDRHSISLEPWSDEDPEQTWVQVTFENESSDS